ncbi:MAG: hypothetical protein ACPHN2_04125 [Sinimarinibacterium flocculans]|uniref:hypothetical protein n=1 Tax=Sinimarinibacterium flocculans TaxID=985250 RepID=UPI003C5812D5
MRNRVKTILVPLLLSSMVTGGAWASDGNAIATYWPASAAEYQATAEAHLEALGARNVREPALGAALVADFLLLFSGGGGAPLDLVSPRTDVWGAQASEQ